MRFAFFIDKLRNGGAERVTTILANYFAKENEVYLFVVDDSQIDYDIDQSIKLYTVPYAQNKVKRMALRCDFIIRKIKEIGFDGCITLTYTFLPYIIAAPKNRRGKVIASLRNAPQYEIGSNLGRFLRWVGFTLCDSIVFQTPDACNYFTGNIRKKGVVIPNPLSQDLPYASRDRAHTVVMATRLEPQKNIPLAIEAFRKFYYQHKNWTLEIYGRGGLEKEVEKLIQADCCTSSAIHLNGFSSNIHEIMANSGMFLMTSDFEGLSNSLIEAMAIGTPVISTDCPIGGARMVIRNGENGYLVPVGDSEEICRAMCCIADDSERAMVFSKESQKIRELLGTEAICERWKAVLLS